MQRSCRGRGANDWIEREEADGEKVRVFDPENFRRRKKQIGALSLAALETQAKTILLLALVEAALRGWRKAGLQGHKA